MSLDTTNDYGSRSLRADENGRHVTGQGAPVTHDQWLELRKKIRRRAETSPPSATFGDAVKKGSVYCWGIAVATGGPIGANWRLLSRLAADRQPSPKQFAKVDLSKQLDTLLDVINQGSQLPLDAAQATLWAAAMPSLIDHLSLQQWWDLLSSLQQFRESLTQRDGSQSPGSLIGGGELGLTLAWRLADLPSCARLQKSSIQCVAQWCKHEEDSIAAAIQGGVNARLVFASLMRSKKILAAQTKRGFQKQQLHVAADFAAWIAALTTHSGGSAHSQATGEDVRDDLDAGGLLDEAVASDRESLAPAMKAALGKSQSAGRLAWEVSLPETLQHSDDAKLAIMLPEWDVRRGRVHADYSAPEMSLELFAGKPAAISGNCQTSIEIDEALQIAAGPWESTCQYTDDDVHYLELEQPWSGGIVLQRQIMVVRDDRCVLLADSVLPAESGITPDPSCAIRYCNRLPFDLDIGIEPAADTREVFFTSTQGRRDSQRCGMVIPLSANEWRIGTSEATLKTTEDRHLLHTAHGRGRLYAPLWFDFQQRRFDRPRTWRQLTVAHELRIVAANEAVGYRIQVGSEQWMLYRSLSDRVCRSVLGKHMVADFYAARFYASEGTLDELVTVDGDETDE